MRLLAWLQETQGQAEAAQTSLQVASQLIERSNLTPVTHLHYLTQQILVHLAQGHLDRAVALVEQAPQLDQIGSLSGALNLALAQVRVHLAQMDRELAWDKLSTLYTMASIAGWQSAVVKVRALQAVAAPSVEEAQTLLQDALAMAAPEGYIRTFVDLGQPMNDLLLKVLHEQRQELHTAVPTTTLAYTRRLLNAFQAGTAPLDTPIIPTSMAMQPLVEPLSERELQVLSLLAEGQTRHEIAQVLYVSVNTIKAHLKGIYGKMSVHNRREAVAKARELGLLS